nr:TadE-like family protein [Paenarthrobacter aurescens]
MENQSTVGRWSLLRLRTGRRQRRRRDERGTSGVVFLMMATSMFLLFTILVQYGINLYAARVAEAAAREGAQAAAHWDGTSGDGSSTAKEYVTQDGSPAVRGSTVSASRSGTEARVTVTVQVASVLPWMDDPITSTATAPVERWTQ